MDEIPRSNSGRTLNRLVSELTLDERHNLLDKLKGQSNLSSEPLYIPGDDNEENQENFEELYARLPWFYRLYYFILGLLKSRPPVRIFEDTQIGTMGREIDALAPGLYDYQRNFLLPDFCRALTDLKEAARFFFEALDVSVNRDKGTFYSFLGSLEMPDVHKRLDTETDPELIAQSLSEASETEIKQKAYAIMEDAFSAITTEHKNAMYKNARSLICLKELSSFLFDRVIMAFGFASSGQTCSANVVKDPLLNLNNVLFSLREIPPLPLMEALFIFILSEKSGDNNFDMSLEMRGLMNKAENSLASIRGFNKMVPLTRILRCAYRDKSLYPKHISGGEDWFVVYRDYWKRHIDMKLDEFFQNRRHDDLKSSFRYFLKGTNLKILNNVISDSTPGGLPVPEAFALSFLLTFYSAVFISDLNKTLRPILIDGEFIKRDNRIEFAESYNDLIKIEDDIKRFEHNISPAGDYGKRYSQAKQDMSSLSVKRRKVQLVMEDVSRDAGGIIEQSKKAMGSMINLLNGIMQKDPGGKYDTLNNLAQLSGKTSEFVAGIPDSVQKFQQALQLLNDINIVGSIQ